MEQLIISLLSGAAGGNTDSERAIATFPSFFPQGPLDRIYYRGPLRVAAPQH
mgnify:CR=1 FL=1